MGYLTAIKGILVKAKGIDAKLYDLVAIGEDGFGEVIAIVGDTYFIQVFTDVTGLSVGQRVEGLGMPLSLELGPHLTGHFFDGLGVSLEEEPFYHPTIRAETSYTFDFQPTVKKGQKVGKGAIIGTVSVKEGKQELSIPIIAPPTVGGVVEELYPGNHAIRGEPIAVISGTNVELSHHWPVRQPRPFKSRVWISQPLITGQRVVDTFVPIAKGGTLAIPGGFGCGKTVFQHTFAKYSDADKKVFVGCGERGNEMADFIESMRKRGKLHEVVVIANTSNMPLIAREGSIYSGVTVAEYLRDIGYSVLMMADSLSRWAEAIREVGGVMGILPAEEGYPPYLQERMQEFYSRAGCVKTFSDKKACLTISTSVSPPSGDFSEPVTQYASSLVDTTIFLSTELAYSKMYPAVDLELSFSKHRAQFANFWESTLKGTSKSIDDLLTLIHKGFDVEKMERIVGADALSDEQKVILHIFRFIRFNYLIQNAFDPKDVYTTPLKMAYIVSSIHSYYTYLTNMLKKGGKPKFQKDVEDRISKMRYADEASCKKLYDEVKGMLGYV